MNDRQERALNRAVLIGRFKVPVLVMMALVSITCGSNPGAPPRGSSEPGDHQEEEGPPSRSHRGLWSPPPNLVVFTMTESDCLLDPADRAIRPSKLTFVAQNRTDELVAFDIGKLADGHMFGELAKDVGVAMSSPGSGGPAAQRPGYFKGSIVGDIRFAHWGAPGPSLLWVDGSSLGSSLTWSYHPRAYDLADPRGIWAAICYRPSEHGRGFEPIGVVGPVEVGQGL